MLFQSGRQNLLSVSLAMIQWVEGMDAFGKPDAVLLAEALAD